MSKKNVKLTMAAASRLARGVFPGIKLERDKTVPDVAIYRGSTGPDGLSVRIENDWLRHDGAIHMIISDFGGMGCMERIYDPDTMERNIDAEEDAKRKDAKQERIEWVRSIGKELAHGLVDKYWEEGKA